MKQNSSLHQTLILVIIIGLFSCNSQTNESSKNERYSNQKSEQKLRKTLYSLYKNESYETMKGVISKNQDLSAKMVVDLIEGTKIFAKGSFADNKTEWSNGNFLNTSEMFRIAYVINQNYHDVTNKNAIVNIDEEGKRISMLLEQSANDMKKEAYTHDFINNKLKQANEINEIIEKKSVKNSSTKSEHYKNQSTHSKKSSAQDPAITATVTRIMSGRIINNAKTMLIAVDKGTKDGVYIGLIGYYLIGVGHISEFRVFEVSQSEAIMEGWYDNHLHRKTKIQLVLEQTQTHDPFDYFEKEGIEPALNED